ncbi:hypothetical protein SLEP1_g38716 [Rubroshorea leprosula]|uniref:Cytochrome P450 n=1 Tax=Rubroshorea leprosula TaxID=152421 RepID=A0AAV5KY68_9ROSI|nr:hypothetical protein SLEP1_g38716 [Rubroshorea leprosula]
MDSLLSIPSPATAAVAVLALSLILFLWISKFLGRSKNKEAPEASGTRPLFGHLHLLGGPKPPHITLGDLAEKHGPIFTIRLGVCRALVVSNWEIARECFTTNDKAFINRPKYLVAEILGYNYAMFSFSSHLPYWRQIRKIAMLEVLSNYRLELLKHVRESEIRTSIKELHALLVGKDRGLVEMKRWFSSVTLNIVFKMVMGKRYAEEESRNQTDENERKRKALRDFFELAGAFAMADVLPFLRWLDIGGYEKAMKKTAKDLDGILQEWLDEHKKKRNSGEKAKGEHDFMDVMLSVLDDSEEIPSYEADTIVKATCLGLILGGTDTNTVTLTWALSLLLNNRDVLKKAQEELDTRVGRERRVQESDLKDLVYLQAILKETLRLYPAATLSVPHESAEDCTTGGYHVPAGTRLIVNLYKLHRDPNVWPNPYEFKPERFRTTHKHVDVRGQNFELIPFGSGRRVCPGISFALQVLQLTLANLLHSFEITTALDEPVDMTENAGLTNLKATPLEVLLTPRLPAHLYE